MTAPIDIGFDDLHDLDKGAVLLHLWKVSYEGRGYAEDNYPCRFLGDEKLCFLSAEEANRLARSFGTVTILTRSLGQDEFHRLYDLACEVADLLAACPEDVSTPRRRAHTARVLAWLREPEAMQRQPRRPFLIHAVGAENFLEETAYYSFET